MTIAKENCLNGKNNSISDSTSAHETGFTTLIQKFVSESLLSYKITALFDMYLAYLEEEHEPIDIVATATELSTIVKFIVKLHEITPLCKEPE